MVLAAIGREARLSFLKVEKNGAGVDGIGEGLVYSTFFFLTRSRTFFFVWLLIFFKFLSVVFI